jgi:hypothetical protein
VAERDDAEDDADYDERDAAATDEQLRPGHENEGPLRTATLSSVAACEILRIPRQAVVGGDLCYCEETELERPQ